ncbi:MAG: hypothetical protein PF795_07645 [Kiritimatiellae bacterium]|jgi:hypothetical protein|nr:hypothetical protein [Kiritimatiellia bacterium]
MTNTPLFLVLTLAACITSSWAQPPDGRPPREDRARSERRGPEATSAPVERYLNQLQAENPEEYQRLSDLREQDPSAFRRELRRKAYEKRGNPSARSDRPHPLQEEISALRNAENEEDREVAIQAIRAKISERVDHSLAEREKAIQEIRVKLQRLEEQNEQERTRREEIIAHHMQRIVKHVQEQSEPAQEQGNNTP